MVSGAQQAARYGEAFPEALIQNPIATNHARVLARRSALEGENMPACLACGNELNPANRFCNRCGRPSGPLPSTVPQASVKIWLIGSDPACDVVLAGPTVSARHCRLVRQSNGYWLEDLGSTNGTFVNGQPIYQPTPVQPQDTIFLGRSTRLSWPEPLPSRPVPETPPAWTGAPSASLGNYAAPPSNPFGDAAPPAANRSWPGVSPSAPTVPAARQIRIGRDLQNDVVLDYPMISANHARVLIAGNDLFIEDLGSTNGLALNHPTNRVTRSPLRRSDTVYFGSFSLPAARLLSGKLLLGAQSHATLDVEKETLVFGRDPACDQVLDYPMISWRHARFSRAGGQFSIEDLGSTNGTYVNGQRLSGRVAVQPGDTISLGSFSFTLTSQGKLEKRDYRGNVTLEARRLTVEVPGRRLLEDVSLTIFPSELVGLMGPSGAGKTTLMNVLNGYTPPSNGNVLLNGVDLYGAYNQFCGHLGYVPQDDIMHPDLTVRQALYFTARLRLPRDYSDEHIHQRIDEVLGQLGLKNAADVLIGSPEKKGISGGQRKRVNLAMELLTDPSVLFLDEPTSGLSSEDALMVMKELRRLADAGKTILITIHQPSLEVFRLMTSLVVVAKDKDSAAAGKLAYFGPAYPDSVKFFNPLGFEGVKDPHEPPPEEMLRGLGKRPANEWAQTYQTSALKRQFVDQRAGQVPTTSAGPIAPKMTRRWGLGQWLTLVKRCCTIKAKDTWNTLVLLSQAPIIALLIVAVFGERVSTEMTTDNWFKVAGAVSPALFLLVVAALWFGCSNAAREIVGEWAIYRRERMVNLKIPSYVASKLTVLGGLCFLQCLVMLALVAWGCDLQGNWLALLGLLTLVALVGTGFGLLVSALARTSEVALGLVPLILIPMVILGGALFPRHDMPQPAQSLTQAMASRWAFEGVLLLESEARKRFVPPAAPLAGAPTRTAAASKDLPKEQDVAETLFPKDKRFTVAECSAVLAGMLVLLLTAILSILRQRDVH